MWDGHSSGQITVAFDFNPGSVMALIKHPRILTRLLTTWSDLDDYGGALIPVLDWSVLPNAAPSHILPEQ